MLVFRKGQWKTVQLPAIDPMFSLAHKQRLAAAVSGAAVSGAASGAEAFQKAEIEIYKEIFSEIKYPQARAAAL